jgi:hypothetical protein
MKVMVRKALPAILTLAALAAAAGIALSAIVLLPPAEKSVAPKESSRFEHAFEVPALAHEDRANSAAGDREGPLPENVAVQPPFNEFAEIKTEEAGRTVVLAKINRPSAVNDTPFKHGLAILQIGDSHTSADYFSGEVRRLLQARYGQGGSGYLMAGRPHNGGVRSSSVKITASSGWAYKSLQSSDAVPGNFWLSGYDSVATKRGEVMSFVSERPIAFEAVEIEALRQPDGGAIEVLLDGHVAKEYDLGSERIEPVVIRISAQHANAQLREVQIKTTEDRKVSISSLSIYNNSVGLTYNSVGYVGATVGILNKMENKLFASDLRRINPQIVVLSFGTNEAADRDLDLVKYRKSYEDVVEKIRSVLPKAVIAVILPPDFNQLSAGCPKEKAREATCTAPGSEGVSRRVAGATPMPVPASELQCAWQTPAKLALVRDVQQDIAKRYGLVYWNWASVMPSECGAHRWHNLTPALMSRDHIHFTVEGYRRSADQFVDILIPIIERVRAHDTRLAN